MTSMRIPGMVLRQSMINRYGGASLELTPGHEEPGCPLAYELTYVKPRTRTGGSIPLSYGTVIHEALYLMEDEGLPYDDALKRAWRPELGPHRYDEALLDLEKVVERGGLMTTLHTVAVEQELKAPLYEDETWGPVEFGGRLDVIAVDGEVDEKPRLYVVDYKTDRGPPSYARLNEWMQGRSYAWLAWQNVTMYLPDVDPNEVEIVVVYDAVKWYALRKSWSHDELRAWQAWAEAIARKILRDDNPKPRLNPGCGWCEFKHECPAWSKLPKTGASVLQKLTSATSLEDRVKFMDQANEMKNRLGRAVDEVKALIEDRVRSTDEPFVVGDRTWMLSQGTIRSIDARSLHGVMGDDFYEVVNVLKGKVDRWVDRHLDQAPAVERSISEMPGEMKLTVRKTKEKDDGTAARDDQGDR